MGTPHLLLRPDAPDFLDLDWERSIADWNHERMVDLPRGIHRHEVVFVAYDDDVYVIKELPRRYARREHEVLRALEPRSVPTASPIGLVERPWVDPHYEWSAAVITRYVRFAFPYRELVEAGSFGKRRTQMIDGLANLLVELHLAGCFWGDCSLSNVLYRFDAEAVQATMIDAETAEIHEQLSDGQRKDDIEIMQTNVAGGMADIAAAADLDLDAADLEMGLEVARRYWELWTVLTDQLVIAENERFKIRKKIQELNKMGFEVDEVDLVPAGDGHRLRLRVEVGGRRYHATRLRELTRVEATERQARQILSDVYYYQASGDAHTPSGKAVSAIHWRVGVFEPLLARLRAVTPEGADPVQAYCDFLHHRYALSSQAGQDVGNEVAFDDWVACGQPGYPLR